MQSDEALYKEVCDGSKAAFEELYDRYERPLFGFILRRIGNQQDAEEILHDVMLSLLKESNARFEKDGFAAWLYKVALNRSLNRLRSRSRANDARQQMGLYVAESKRIDDHLLEQEKSSHLRQAAESLSTPLREVYDLRQSGKSYEETANTLGLPLGSVKSRIHMMVTHLRKEMSKWTAE